MDTEKAVHTPGPWSYKSVNFDDYCPTEHFISAPNRPRICRLSSPDAEGRANAALISAAPDLLEALKVLLSQVSPKAREFPRMFGPIEIAEAAIAKAEGVASPSPVVYYEPCRQCGREDLPLHTDYRCPNCHGESRIGQE